MGSCGLVRRAAWTSEAPAAAVLVFKTRYEILTLQLHPISVQPPHRAEWVWRTLKLDSAVTTRVHQPLSYSTSLTISDMPGGAGFLHHTEWFMLSPGSSKVWVLKRKHAKADFLSFHLGVPHRCRRALCGWQHPAVAVCGRSGLENFTPSHYFSFLSLCCLRSHLYFSLTSRFMADAA